MIDIQARGNAPKIVLTPRPGFKRTHKEQEFELIYGHKCPTCSNVIQAVFLTDKKIDLFAYEQTSIMSQSKDVEKQGDVAKVLPNGDTGPGYSCYNTDFTLTEGGGSQKIVLKNHVMRVRAITEREYNGDGLFEKGDLHYTKACTKTGIHALRNDLLVKDYCLFSMMTDVDLRAYSLPTVEKLMEGLTPGHSLGTLVPAVGKAPPLILIERQTLIHGFTFVLRPRLEAWKVKAPTQKAA